MRATWPNEVIGITPGMIGTSMPTSRAEVTKWKWRVSKNSCVIRNEAPTVDLGLQVREVGGRVFGLGMDLREAGAADGERVALGDQSGELSRGREPVLGGVKSVSPRGGSPRSASTLSIPIAAKRSRIARRPGRVSPTQLQVCHDLEPVLGLDALGDLDRPVAPSRRPRRR